MEKMVKNYFLGFFKIFVFFDANFLGNENGSKWIVGGQATNAIGKKWQGSELSGQSMTIFGKRDNEPWVKKFCRSCI